jgi:hypothetical protein
VSFSTFDENLSDGFSAGVHFGFFIVIIHEALYIYLTEIF